MSRACANTCPQKGFTLAEMLVALFILSILAVAGGNLLLRGTASGEQLREREAVIRQLDIAQAFIRSDFEAAVTRGVEPPEGYDGAMTLVGGETNRTDALFQLVRSGWMNPGGMAPRSDLQPVRYDLTPEGELVRTAWLRPDATVSTPTAKRILLTGIADIEMTFWKGNETSTYWEGTPTPPDNVLPELVEMQIRFEDDRVLVLASQTGSGS
ncbi:type II secretion system minor pseudopilin GspJ [Henriciella sp.]|uniref:type II secretion system minor pseudopilin GspJ n=1 Tax=Henriciella sp. TaxID=1968823 RepID=UPI00262D3B5B|nr:type II secretion system minor pseudopilin GspJ [Henriciella sp.]